MSRFNPHFPNAAQVFDAVCAIVGNDIVKAIELGQRGRLGPSGCTEFLRLKRSSTAAG